MEKEHNIFLAYMFIYLDCAFVVLLSLYLLGHKDKLFCKFPQLML